MPTPPSLPPNTASDLGGPINNFTPENIQYVTPSQSELNQEQTSTGVGNASSYSAPQVTDIGTNAYSQNVYTNYGENAEVCIEGAGCETVPFVDVTTYYGRSDLSSRVENFVNNGSYSDQSNFGIQGRLMIPIGGRSSKNLDTLAKQVITKTEQQNNKDLLKTCISLKSPVDGRLAVIDYDNASPVMQKIHDDCQGVNVLVRNDVPQTDPRIDALIEENRLLKQKLAQLLDQGIPQRVGN